MTAEMHIALKSQQGQLSKQTDELRNELKQMVRDEIDDNIKNRFDNLENKMNQIINNRVTEAEDRIMQNMETFEVLL